MSEIKVDVVSPYTGTGLQIGESGDTVTVPSGANLKVNNIDVVAVAPSTSGKVLTSDGTNWTSATPAGGGKLLQVVSGIKTDTFTTGSSSFVDVTGLTVTTGTLASTSSRVLVMVSMVGSAWDDYSNWRVVDGAGAIIVGFVGDAYGSARRSSGADLFGIKYSPNVNQLTMNSIDSPSSTTAQTYKVQVQTTSGNIYINRGYTDGTTTNRQRSMSSIIAMEIGA
mgnify:CR=1 FL=1